MKILFVCGNFLNDVIWKMPIYQDFFKYLEQTKKYELFYANSHKEDKNPIDTDLYKAHRDGNKYDTVFQFGHGGTFGIEFREKAGKFLYDVNDGNLFFLDGDRVISYYYHAIRKYEEVGRDYFYITPYSLPVKGPNKEFVKNQFVCYYPYPNKSFEPNFSEKENIIAYYGTDYQRDTDIEKFILQLKGLDIRFFGRWTDKSIEEYKDIINFNLGLEEKLNIGLYKHTALEFYRNAKIVPYLTRKRYKKYGLYVYRHVESFANSAFGLMNNETFDAEKMTIHGRFVNENNYSKIVNLILNMDEETYLKLYTLENNFLKWKCNADMITKMLISQLENPEKGYINKFEDFVPGESELNEMKSLLEVN